MTHARNTALLTAALNAAERGWYVHPLQPGRKAPALHGERFCPRTGECALGHRKWEQRATLDTDRIHMAWAARPFNVGIAPGPSGLMVVDLDVLKPEDDPDTPDGVSAFHALCERAGQAVPLTHTVRTPSGGAHLYFATPPGARLPSSKGTLAKKIDTRAWGGNIVAAGSTASGGVYETEGAAPVLSLPDWLREALTPPKPPGKPLSLVVPAQVGRYAETVLRREEAAIRAARKPNREATLFRAARAMGRFVAWGDIPRHVVEDAFHPAAESTGLPPARCRSTLRSALDWSIAHAHPRGDGMSTPPTPGVKSGFPTPTGPSFAEPAPTPSGPGAPKVAARQGALSGLRPDPHQADGRYPVAWLHVTAPPERNVTPYATSWCQCGHERSAMGRRAVLRLIEAHTAHRAVCPLRTTEGRNPA